MDNKYYQNVKNTVPCLWHGLICGCLTGAAIFVFRYAARDIEAASRHLYSLAATNKLYTVLAILAALVLGVAMAYLHKRVPEIRGGGIPRSEGILRGLLPFKWKGTLIWTALGSFMSFLCGIPVGSEGPAVLIGTCVGEMSCGLSKRKFAIDRYVMTGGAGAGFAVATGSPLSALLFSLEEIHRRFTPMLVMTVSVSVLSSTVVNRLLCSLAGMNPRLFELSFNAGFALSDVVFLVILGIFIAVSVGIFDLSISLFKRFSKSIKRLAPDKARLIFLFGVVSLMGIFLPDAIYSGHHVIEEILHEDKTVMYLALILVLRFALMLFVTDCGATGGIFIPTLAIGVLFSAIFSRLLPALGMSQELVCAATFLGMCAFLGGTLRAPFTACVLFVELSGNFSDLFYAAITVFTVNLVTELFARKPFYDSVLEDTVTENSQTKDWKTGYYRIAVSEDSFVCGKTVRDIMWPYFCVVLSVEHRKIADSVDAYFNDGEKKLYAGDIITMRVKYTDEDELWKRLCALVGCNGLAQEVDCLSGNREMQF